MHVFSDMMSYHHEQVVFGYDPEVGLRAIIAIHDTSLGPALGGTRMWPYRSEAEALNDVLRLSRGMTAKAAVAGLNLGGSKGVIIGDASYRLISNHVKSNELMVSHGGYDNTDANRDINSMFPLDRLRELAADGLIKLLLTICS